MHSVGTDPNSLRPNSFTYVNVIGNKVRQELPHVIIELSQRFISPSGLSVLMVSVHRPESSPDFGEGRMLNASDHRSVDCSGMQVKRILEMDKSHRQYQLYR